MDPVLFSTLAEPNRLQIVELLYKHPCPVNDIVEQLHLNQPQVSKHLKILADAGLVKVYPVKQQRIYALAPQPFKDMDKWLEKFRSMWEKRLNRLDTILQK